jgi:RNA-directed DNA polymerase
VGEHDLTARHPPSLRRAGCLANGHVRFGRRAAETGQRKLWHRAAVRPHNLVYHPDFLTVAWERVRGNKGARTAGVDRVISRFISEYADVVAFLGDARDQLKSRVFSPLPVRERLIPKAGQPGKFRRLGIPTAMDRLVQASLVLVLEPIFEAGFKPVSYGFRPMRRGQDAIAEIHHLATLGSCWVFEADIAACFDELSRSAILDQVRRRVGDKRVLALIKAFLAAGIMPEAGQQVKGTLTGTPQGLSVIRRRTSPIRAAWSISSKQAVMSPSSTHS